MVLRFKEWLIAENQIKYIKPLSMLSKLRKYPGDQYKIDLLPRLQRLNNRWGQINIDDWYVRAQQEDGEFYALVQGDLIGQPDVRELWRDLTGRSSTKMTPGVHQENL